MTLQNFRELEKQFAHLSVWFQKEYINELTLVTPEWKIHLTNICIKTTFSQWSWWPVSYTFILLFASKTVTCLQMIAAKIKTKQNSIVQSYIYFCILLSIRQWPSSRPVGLTASSQKQSYHEDSSGSERIWHYLGQQLAEGQVYLQILLWHNQLLIHTKQVRVHSQLYY